MDDLAYPIIDFNENVAERLCLVFCWLVIWIVIHCMWAYCSSSCVIHVAMSHWEHHNTVHMYRLYTLLWLPGWAGSCLSSSCCPWPLSSLFTWSTDHMSVVLCIWSAVLSTAAMSALLLGSSCFGPTFSLGRQPLYNYTVQLQILQISSLFSLLALNRSPTSMLASCPVEYNVQQFISKLLHVS